jgi:cell division protein FtsB
MLALLFENGFMDSTKDTPIILTDDFANKAANAYVETLVKIGGLTKKPTEDKTAKLEKENADLKKEVENLKAKIANAIKALQ